MTNEATDRLRDEKLIEALRTVACLNARCRITREQAADALAQLQAERDQLNEYMESARVGYEAEKEARQKATQERDDALKECDRLIGLVPTHAPKGERLLLNGYGRKCYDAGCEQAEARVDRLTAALREIAHQDSPCGCSLCPIWARAALAHADPEVKT